MPNQNLQRNEKWKICNQILLVEVCILENNERAFADYRQFELEFILNWTNLQTQSVKTKIFVFSKHWIKPINIAALGVSFYVYNYNLYFNL